MYKLSEQDGRAACSRWAVYRVQLKMWAERSTLSKVCIVAAGTGLCIGTVVTLRVARKVYHLFSHTEEVYSW